MEDCGIFGRYGIIIRFQVSMARSQFLKNINNIIIIIA